MRKKILAGFILLMSVSSGIEAQGLDQDCNPLVEPRECQQFVEAITSLDTRIARFQQRLRDASPATKQDLLRTIDQLNSQRSTATAELTRCRREHGAAPRLLAPNELVARFSGTATVRTTDNNADGPFDVDLELVLRFTRDRCWVTITSFPSIKFKTKDLPVIGRINVAVTKTDGGNGSFHPVSGAMSIPITLHFHYDTVLLGDDDAAFGLTTGRSISRNGVFNVTGSPLTPDGTISLTGTTRFRNGYLSDKEGSLVITANISPRP
jgi:hypothetical protein